MLLPCVFKTFYITTEKIPWQKFAIAINLKSTDVNFVRGSTLSLVILTIININ